MTTGTTRRPFWPLIGLLTLLGAVPRLWNLDRLGLTHFDEGMYAMAALWVTLPRGLAEIDPAAALYAPPGFATLVGLGYFFVGIADVVPILVSIAAGVAVVPLAALVARQSFGPAAGVAAAALAACSGPHVAFSRMALTDALFLDAWLLAMLAGGRFLDRPGLGRAIGLGLAVGLAQNVKYNGGLAGIVVAIAAAVGWIARREDSAAARRGLGLLVAAGLIAGVLYAPWAWYVEQHVGYAKLAAHHRGYAGGPADWPGHLNVQLAQVVALSGGRGWAAAAAALAVLGARAVVGGGGGGGTGLRLWLSGGGFLVLAALAAAVEPSWPWWVGLAWVPFLVAEPHPMRRLLAVWWIVTTLITPLYHPYARLWLPVEAAGWVLAAGLIARIWEALRAPSGEARRGFGPRAGLAAAVLLALVARAGWNRANPPRPLPGLLAPTDSFRRHLAEASPDPRTTGAQLLQVLARPHSSLYLVMGSLVPFQKMSGLDQLLDERRPDAWALVDAVMLRQEGDLDAARRRLLAAFEPVRGWAEALPPATLLDIAPGAAFGDLSARESRWMLLRPRNGPELPTAPR